MESGLTNALLYCLTIAFVGALVTFGFGTVAPPSHSDRYDTLHFFVWATFTPWIVAIVVKVFQSRRSPL